MMSGKRSGRKVNATGRNEGGGKFVMLPHRLLKSTAYASLDLVARGLLQELVMVYAGNNNGSLWMGARDATARLGLADYRPALRAFGDLQQRGFITLAKDAHFAIKASDTCRARCWRLTWHSWADCPTKSKRAPTNEWERYSPPGKTPESKRADRRLRALDRHRKDIASGRLPVVESTTMEAILPKFMLNPVVKSTTVKSETRANLRKPVVVESTTHIDTTMGSAGVGWWKSQVEADLLTQIHLLKFVTQNRRAWIGRHGADDCALRV